MKATNMIAAAAIAATLVVPATVFAGQAYGRDSVYATPGGGETTTTAAAATTRAGRDSVYATQAVAPVRTIDTAEVTPKSGRA
jgi:hypothetical protein